MRRPKGNIQTSTGIGVTGLINHLIFIFNGVKVDQLIPTVHAMTIDELIVTAAPFFLWIWAIFHNEEGKNEEINRIEL